MPIQAALSCFANGKVTASSTDPSVPGQLVFNGGRPTKLNGPSRLRLGCTIEYAIVDSGQPAKPWKVHTTGYIFRLLKSNGSGLVDFHWHPTATPEVSFPHLHAREYGCKRHYPTGRVMVEDVFVLAIECGAIPGDRAKWQRVLKANRENFALGATWGTSHPSRP